METMKDFVNFCRINRTEHSTEQAIRHMRFAYKALCDDVGKDNPCESFWSVCDAICELMAWLDTNTSDCLSVLNSYSDSRMIQQKCARSIYRPDNKED